MADSITNANVRQFCLRLRPILGPKMDQIYQAYLAEDDEGKKQIGRYLEMLLTKYIPQKLDQGENVLLPPEQDRVNGEYAIGSVQYADKDLYPFGLRENEWIQHLGIVGRSGAGKTNCGFLILQELHRHKKSFLLFDWKRNYRDLVALPEFNDVEIYTIGRDIAPLTFNPLIPPQGIDPKTWFKKLNEVIANAYCLGDGVLYLLQQAVDAVYQEAGVYDGTVQRWPTFKDVLVKARNMDTRGRESGWLSSTLRALSTLCFGEMDRLLNTNNNQSIDHILQANVILELDALSQSDKTFFVQATMLYIQQKLMGDGRREEFTRAVILEEAHHVLSNERRSLIGGQSVMDVVFRELRELGVSLVFLDQHPSKISFYALGNSYCTICMNLKHKTDINAISQCLLLDKEKDILGTLEVGQAVVKLQGRVQKPFLISMPEFKIQKGRMTDALVREHMQDRLPGDLGGDGSQALTDPSLPSVEISIPKTTLNTEEAAFLCDVQEYPDSGVAQRYKRLGLSVRQGQKIKTHLVIKGMISEETMLTKQGRLTFIRLTENGERCLEEAQEG